MGKSIKQRIKDSFKGDEAAVQAKDYRDTVYAAWKDISSSLSRYTLLIVLLMALFELLTSERTSTSISIGSFTLANSPIVQIVLPTIIAYEVYQSYTLTGRWIDLEDAYIELTKICADAQNENELDELIRPFLPVLWGIGARPTASVARPIDSFNEDLGFTLFLFAGIIVPIAFECLAYYQLFHRFNFRNALLWISLIITTAFLISAGIYLYLRPGEEKGE